jgi:hypothetical protein
LVDAGITLKISQKRNFPFSFDLSNIRWLVDAGILFDGFKLSYDQLRRYNGGVSHGDGYRKFLEYLLDHGYNINDVYFSQKTLDKMDKVDKLFFQNNGHTNFMISLERDNVDSDRVYRILDNKKKRWMGKFAYICRHYPRVVPVNRVSMENNIRTLAVLFYNRHFGGCPVVSFSDEHLSAGSLKIDT